MTRLATADPAAPERPASGVLATTIGRLRAGDIGAAPVVLGLAVIWTVFQSLNPVFLSSANLVNLTMQCASVGMITLGVVVVLLVGQIDLSVGSVSGLASALLAVALVQGQWPWPAAVLVAALSGVGVGLLYGLLVTRFGVPSFVVTLAGLLGFLGLQLRVLGDTGSINLPFDSVLVFFAQQLFLPWWAGLLVAVVAAAAYAVALLRRAGRRAAADLGADSRARIAVRSGALLAVLLFAAWYLSLSRGIGAMFLLFVVAVVVMDVALSRTRWGRAVYAIGGSAEAARRAGIHVRRIYVSAFVVCSTLAAIGGILAASRLAAANQSSGGGDVNLNAIAAAVIGGTSLFGGRGSAYSALLGVLVVQSLSSGLTLLSLDSSVRYMITGAVLVLAVIVDAAARRSRVASGRA